MQNAHCTMLDIWHSYKSAKQIKVPTTCRNKLLATFSFIANGHQDRHTNKTSLRHVRIAVELEAHFPAEE